MSKFKVFYKESDEGLSKSTTVSALNHIDAEQQVAKSHNLPFKRILMSKSIKTGKLHTP